MSSPWVESAFNLLASIRGTDGIENCGLSTASLLKSSGLSLVGVDVIDCPSLTPNLGRLITLDDGLLSTTIPGTLSARPVSTNQPENAIKSPVCGACPSNNGRLLADSA